MATPREAPLDRLRARLASHLGHAQHRNAYYLMLNTLTGAAAGLLFWFLLTGLGGLPPAEIGVGYVIVALGTIVAVVARGGLDTALVRTVPGASRDEGVRLLRFGAWVAVAAALLVALGLALALAPTRALPDVTPLGWGLVALIGTLLVVTWLQDAHFLAEGEARFSFHRNLVLSGARLLLPLPVLALALPQPVALTWALALAASALAAIALVRRLASRDGRRVPRREFLTSALRNVSGGAAEFLPGLVLAPVVLALEGPTAAGYFGIAWAAASLLFLASAAISRSALAEMVRRGPAGRVAAIERGVLQHAYLVLPAALVGAVLAPQLLSVFGPAYAREAGVAFALLCASALAVAPGYLYLALLRARDRPRALVVYPAALVATLAVLVPLLESRLGLDGVALAWLLANVPFGAYGAWKLRRAVQGVTLHEPAPPLNRAAHVE